MKSTFIIPPYVKMMERMMIAKEKEKPKDLQFPIKQEDMNAEDAMKYFNDDFLKSLDINGDSSEPITQLLHFLKDRKGPEWSDVPNLCEFYCEMFERHGFERITEIGFDCILLFAIDVKIAGEQNDVISAINCFRAYLPQRTSIVYFFPETNMRLSIMRNIGYQYFLNLKYTHLVISDDDDINGSIKAKFEIVLSSAHSRFGQGVVFNELMLLSNGQSIQLLMSPESEIRGMWGRVISRWYLLRNPFNSHVTHTQGEDGCNFEITRWSVIRNVRRVFYIYTESSKSYDDHNYTDTQVATASYIVKQTRHIIKPLFTKVRNDWTICTGDDAPEGGEIIRALIFLLQYHQDLSRHVDPYEDRNWYWSRKRYLDTPGMKEHTKDYISDMNYSLLCGNILHTALWLFTPEIANYKQRIMEIIRIKKKSDVVKLMKDLFNDVYIKLDDVYSKGMTHEEVKITDLNNIETPMCDDMTVVINNSEGEKERMFVTHNPFRRSEFFGNNVYTFEYSKEEKCFVRALKTADEFNDMVRNAGIDKMWGAGEDFKSICLKLCFILLIVSVICVVVCFITKEFCKIYSNSDVRIQNL
jgi:hypothetical protein